jgi:lysophospholipase-3
LQYNQTDHTTRNNDGVETRIPGFGGTFSVEFLNPYKSSYAGYFSKIVDGLVTLGYQRGVNIHGAPYDFRKAASKKTSKFFYSK